MKKRSVIPIKSGLPANQPEPRAKVGFGNDLLTYIELSNRCIFDYMLYTIYNIYIRFTYVCQRCIYVKDMIINK